MKKLLLPLMALLFISLSLFSQAPEKFKYQAIITNDKDQPVKNKAIGLEISILQNDLNGTIVYQETFSPTTNKSGLVNLEIGTGMITSGVFSDINWSVGSYYLGIAVDMNGTGNYISMGASQLLSVPYALLANKALSVEGENDSDPTNELQNLTLEDDFLKLSLTNDEVSLSTYASHWRLWGDDLLQFTGAVDIGDNYTSGPVLRVDGNITVGKSGENAGNYGIGGPSPESGLSITGGTSGGGQLYLYGPDHFTHPGEIRLKTGGNDNRIVIKPDGNVGIGASAPSYKLDVSGDINFTGTLHQNGNPFNNSDADPDPTNELQDISLSGTSLSLSMGSTIDLGELPDAVNDADPDPTNELISSFYLNGNSVELSDAGGTRTIDLGSLEGDFSDGGDAADTDRTLGNTSDHALSLLTNNANRLHIKNTGEIGIGTTIPSEMLEVAGKIYSKTGGFKFPDGTVQVTASTSGGGASEIDDLSDGKTGGYSVYLGANAGANDDGSGYSFNTAIGNYALSDITIGSGNVAMGYSALKANTEGTSNIGIGNQVLENNTIGNSNVGIGYAANRYNGEGSQNTIVGSNAGNGQSLHNKSGNVFLGYAAGFYETGSNLLYIENSASTSPLIWGDFSQDKIKINGSMEVTSGFKLTSGAHNGYVLTSDASGYGSWQSLSSSPWTVAGNDVYRFTGNVGIGTNQPSFKLDVNGSMRVNGSIRADKLLIPPTDHSYSIAGSTFNPTGGTKYFYSREINYIAINSNVAAGDADLVAPVHIPSGATLENISARVLDNGPATITVSLFLVNYNGGKFNLGSTNSSINSSSVQNLTGSLSSTVDNNNNAFVAVVRCQGTYSASQYYRIYKVTIRYSIGVLP